MRFFSAGADGVAHEYWPNRKEETMGGPGPEKETGRSERRQYDRRHERRRSDDRREKFKETAAEVVATPPDSPGCILARLETCITELKQEELELESLRVQLVNVQASTKPGKGRDTVPRFPGAQPGSPAERALHRLLDKAKP